ncbi:hypothetical protein V6N11_035427 [Hibiscus sabdariffa]|uniref:Secreted protein n=1 Tax=Hibiscus sabdariffa TaxID=183260 RepID=A0ABR2R0C0_9ROSI
MLEGVDSPWKVVLVAVLLELDVFFCGKLARRCYSLAPADEGTVHAGMKCSKPGGEVAERLVLMVVLVADSKHCHE